MNNFPEFPQPANQTPWPSTPRNSALAVVAIAYRHLPKHEPELDVPSVAQVNDAVALARAYPAGMLVVPADVAKLLEIDLNKARSENQSLRAAIKICEDCNAPLLAELRAKIEELQGRVDTQARTIEQFGDVAPEWREDKDRLDWQQAYIIRSEGGVGSGDLNFNLRVWIDEQRKDGK